eukprot:maker-scaffold_3-snap-gene-13.43-mRNA-1 protein AED:0.03 eAED:0.03 QI:109/1/1/1/0/0/6/88/201
MGQRQTSRLGVEPMTMASLNDLCTRTHFDADEVLRLYHYFIELSNGSKLITKDQFKAALRLQNSLFLHRIFVLFDKKGIQAMEFPEFVESLSVLSARGTLDEKIRFAFKMYDLDNDGYISKQELGDMLQSGLAESRVLATHEYISMIVETSFREADLNADGYIDQNEYKVLMEKNPTMLDNFTLDLKMVLGYNSYPEQFKT